MSLIDDQLKLLLGNRMHHDRIYVKNMGMLSVNEICNMIDQYKSDMVSNQL